MVLLLTFLLTYLLNLGNEAADADSIVSSLCYAYHRSCVSSNSLCIPLVGVEKSKFYLRRDVELLLNQIDISITEDLLSLYDIDWKMLKSKNIICNFTLVDHNALASKACNHINYNNLDELIIEILDHHEGIPHTYSLTTSPSYLLTYLDMNQYNHIASSNRLIGYDSIKKTPTVASTCTIISEKISLESNQLNPYYDDIRYLLTGVIGLDTLNMDAGIKKGTPRDDAAYNYCSNYMHSPPNKYINRDKLYKILSEAKNDREFWRSLKVADAVALDYKVFPVSKNRNIGISAMLLPLQEFLTHESMKELLSYMNNEGLILYAIMTSYNNAESRSSSDSTDTNSLTETLKKQVFTSLITIYSLKYLPTHS